MTFEDSDLLESRMGQHNWFLSDMQSGDFDEEAKNVITNFLENPEEQQKGFEDFLDKTAQAKSSEAEADDNKEELQAKAGEERVVEQLKEAIEANDVTVRGSLGQKFTSSLKADPDAQEEYAKLGGQPRSRQLKQEFRVRWARTELSSRSIQRKTKSEIMTESWGNAGTYMTFDRIVNKEGGFQNKKAVSVAVRYCLAALKAGAPYILWHPWKHVTEIWYAERTWSQNFDKVFQLDKIMEGDMAEEPAGGQPSSSTGQSPVAMGTPKHCKTRQSAGEVSPATPMAQKRKDGQKPMDESNQAKKQKLELVKAAEKVKKAYLDCIAQQASIEHSIETDDKYTWAKNDWVLNNFKKCKSQLEAIMDTEDFNRFYLMNDLQACKLQYGSNLDVHMKKFMQADDAVKMLKKEQSKFRKHHIAELTG